MTEDQQLDKTLLKTTPTHPHLLALGVSDCVRVSPLFLHCSSSNIYDSSYNVPGGVDSCSLDLSFLCAAFCRLGRLHIQVGRRYSGFRVSVTCCEIKPRFPLVSRVSQRNRFLSKVQSLSFVPAPGALSQPLPSVAGPPEGQLLATLAPPSYRECSEDEHETQELCPNERAETMNFNNTSYFFMQQNMD